MEHTWTDFSSDIPAPIDVPSKIVKNLRYDQNGGILFCLFDTDVSARFRAFIISGNLFIAYFHMRVENIGIGSALIRKHLNLKLEKI